MMRPVFIATAVIAAIALAGCGEFAQVRLGSVPKPGTTRLVYGLDASNGPLDVALEYHALDGGSCAPITKAESTKGATGIEYFAFDVFPGTYAVSTFNTSSGLAPGKMGGYLVEAGRQNFIGTFRVQGSPARDLSMSMARKHDLDVAKAALGAVADPLELASQVSVTGSGWALCSS